MRYLLLLLVVLLSGCNQFFPEGETDHGCVGPFYGEPNANGQRVEVWECWGGELPPAPPPAP